MNFNIHHKHTTQSTNIDARAGEHCDVFTADVQTAGRGRLDHKWQSAPSMNLMMSVVLDVSQTEVEQAATLPLAIGLAVRNAIATFLPSSKANEVLIKWPNDVFVSWRKISGILCERSGDKVIAGIGVNVAQTSFAADIASRATSLANEGCDVTVTTVRDALLKEISNIYPAWLKNGFPAIHPLFATIDALKGKVISVRQTDDDENPVTGMCRGIQPDGTLLVNDVPIFAGEAHVILKP